MSADPGRTKRTYISELDWKINSTGAAATEHSGLYHACKSRQKEVLQLVKYYRNIENHLCEIEKAEAGCWISVINPTETEISDLEDDTRN